MKVINPLKGRTDRSWFFEQSVYDSDGMTRAMKANGGTGNLPKVIERIKYEGCNEGDNNRRMERKIVLPFNPMDDGTCRPLKRQYQQTSLANLIRGGLRSHGSD